MIVEAAAHAKLRAWSLTLAMDCFRGFFSQTPRPPHNADEAEPLLDKQQPNKSELSCFRGLASLPFLQRPLNDAAARKVASDGLKNIVQGYRQISQLELPAGAASSFANLRRNIIELEKIISQAKMPQVRPCLLPIPGEQASWEAAYPEGGFLLRRQMCMAATDDNIWCVGGLFISDAGVAFDGGNIPGTFRTGFLPWSEVSHIDRRSSGPPGAPAEVTLGIAEGASQFKSLRLQLSICSDAEWLQEFWKLRTDVAVPASPCWALRRSMSIPDEFDSIELPLPSQVPRLMNWRPEHIPGVGLSLPKGALLRASGRSPKRQNSLVEQLAAGEASRIRKLTFSEEAPEEVPELAHPAKTKAEPCRPSGDFALLKRLGPNGEPPVSLQRISGLSIEQVRALILGDQFAARYFQESNKAFDFTAEPWSTSSRVPGLLFRKVSFKVPIDDVPRAIKRLVSVPDISSVTVVWQLNSEDEGITLTGQSYAHGVPFGDNFRMQDTVTIRPSSNGAASLELKKWFETVWVAPLPWTHGIVKSAIESQGMDKSIAGLPFFARILEDLGRM